MEIITVLYVSKSMVSPDDMTRRTAELVDMARIRNASLDVTGALIATGERFAQILEGPAGAVNAIMASVLRDDRHCDIRIIQRTTNARRRFARWDLAYAGPALFVARAVEQVLPSAGEATEPSDMSVERLIRMMAEFVPA